MITMGILSFLLLATYISVEGYQLADRHLPVLMFTTLNNLLLYF